MKVAANNRFNPLVEQESRSPSREFPADPQTCWECDRGKTLHLPCGGVYVDCPPANWKGRACAAKLLATIEERLCLILGKQELDRT